MKLFWIEGLISSKDSSNRKNNSISKPFAQSYWANTAQEALLLAFQENPRIRWGNGPTVNETSEEHRMRAMGAPELPWFEQNPKPKKK